MPLRPINRSIAALLIGLLVALGGCSTPFGQSEYADDPLYGLGYRSTVIRDPEGWGKSKAYRSGWKKGFNACRPSASGNSSAYPADAQGRRNGPSGY